MKNNRREKRSKKKKCNKLYLNEKCKKYIKENKKQKKKQLTKKNEVLICKPKTIEIFLEFRHFKAQNKPRFFPRIAWGGKIIAKRKKKTAKQ